MKPYVISSTPYRHGEGKATDNGGVIHFQLEPFLQERPDAGVSGNINFPHAAGGGPESLKATPPSRTGSRPDLRAAKDESMPLDGATDPPPPRY